MRAKYVMPVLALSLVLTACAAGVNPEVGVASPDGEVAGFWLGLWHGLIAPVTFVVSLFSDTVNVYEVHNNGNWYDFGFIFGAMVALGSSSRGAKRR